MEDRVVKPLPVSVRRRGCGRCRGARWRPPRSSCGRRNLRRAGADLAVEQTLEQPCPRVTVGGVGDGSSFGSTAILSEVSRVKSPWEAMISASRGT